MDCELQWFDSASGRRRKKISYDHFLRLKSKRQVVASSYELERRIDIFFSNYIEFESVLAAYAVGLTVRLNELWDLHGDQRSHVDRVLTNLLSSGNGYKSQAMRYKLDGGRTHFRAQFQAREADSLAFRIVSTLRNYAEHAALPIHGFALPRSWVNDKKSKAQVREHGIEITIDVNELGSEFSKDLSFIGQVRALADEKGHIELPQLIREYVEHMSYIHAHIRSAIEPGEAKAKEELLQVRKEALGQEMDGGYLMALASEDESSSPVAEVFLGDSMEKSLARLKRRNHVPLTNHKHVAYRI